MNNKLTVEQQFTLQVLKKDVYKLNKEQSQEYIIELIIQMMVKDNIAKNLIKKL